MKKLTFDVQCNCTSDLQGKSSENMFIKIKRNDNDLDLNAARSSLKKLIVLCNKNHYPTLFMAVDMNKYPKSDFWHVLYKLNKDEKCPYVTLRIMSQSADFTR
jgi:hypothetical protein